MYFIQIFKTKVIFDTTILFPNISIECSVGGCGEGVGVVMARPGSAQSKVSQWNQETDFMFSTLLLHMFAFLTIIEMF